MASLVVVGLGSLQAVNILDLQVCWHTVLAAVLHGNHGDGRDLVLEMVLVRNCVVLFRQDASRLPFKLVLQHLNVLLGCVTVLLIR